MTVLDAFALIAYFRNEPAADDVADLLRTPNMLTAVNAAEVVDQLVRVYDRDPDDVHADLPCCRTRAWSFRQSARRSACSRGDSGRATTNAARGQ